MYDPLLITVAEATRILLRRVEVLARTETSR
jgi:hypothetical protein